MSVILDIPGDIDVGSEEFRRILNDRIRAISDQLGRGGGSATVTKTTVRGGASTAVVGTLLLNVPGTLGVRSDAAPLVKLFDLVTPSQAIALVKQAPVGAALTANLLVAGVSIGTFTIADGATSGTATLSGPIAAGVLITLDISAVGTTFPGADLSILLRF